MKTERAHGTRVKYVMDRCRCDLCRQANREYARERNRLAVELAILRKGKTKPERRDWHLTTCHGGLKQASVVFERICLGISGKGCPRNSYLKKDSKGAICSYCREHIISKTTKVRATEAREHLKKLSALGLGMRVIERKTGLNRKTLQLIKGGTRTQIEPEVKAAILAMPLESVPKSADLLPSRPTIDRIEELHRRGMTYTEIAKRLHMLFGNFCLLRKRPYVTRKTERRVEALYREAMEEIQFPLEPLSKHCLECDLSHEKSERLKRLARMLPCRAIEVREEYPCVYRPTDAGEKMLYRDLEELGATDIGQTWYLLGAGEAVAQ